MAKKITVVKVSELPPCDICRGAMFGQNNPIAQTALYDAPTRGGGWANLCERHFKSLGVGWGTKFELDKK